MVFLQRTVDEVTPEPEAPMARISLAAETAVSPELIVDPHLIARRVYDLLRNELTVDRVRRGRRM